MKKYSIKDIKKVLGSDIKVIGEKKNLFFNNIMSIEQANSNSLVWIDSRKKNKQELIKRTKARFVICGEDINVEDLIDKLVLIVVKNPKLSFIKIAANLFSKPVRFGIHPTAFINKKAKIHKNVHIGPFSYIGVCEIKKGAVIYGNTFIYDNVSIGENVIIHAGCVIGADGFGYSKDEKQEFEKFPHFGGVIIEKQVEIGANTCIDRGTLGYTLVREGAKIDNLVHIAHNVVIGKHTAVVANSMIGGSTIIGDYSWIAPSAFLMNKIRIGDNVTVGMGAIVTKDIPDGETWAGSPARPIKEFIELLKKLKNL